jgi:[acyl-carrier-protein] S-malonyltransferase
MFVIAAPGQGSQKPGFLEPWLSEDSHRSNLERWSDITQIDLIAHGTTSDLETITDTAIAQPLIVAAGIMTGRALLAALPADAALRCAGHSVGEFTAAALAGVLSDDDALSLVALRGRAMAKASALEPTGMSAVIGGESDELEKSLRSLSLHAANYNGGGQTVVAGSREALAELAKNPPTGARIIPLSVAGAFHTPYMDQAKNELAAAASALTTGDIIHPIYTNRDGSLVEDPATYLGYLVEQVTQPVRWDRCMESFGIEGIHGMMELAPAGALSGLAKRGMKGVPTVAINTPEDISLARDMVGSR